MRQLNLFSDRPQTEIIFDKIIDAVVTGTSGNTYCVVCPNFTQIHYVFDKIINHLPFTGKQILRVTRYSGFIETVDGIKIKFISLNGGFNRIRGFRFDSVFLYDEYNLKLNFDYQEFIGILAACTRKIVT